MPSCAAPPHRRPWRAQDGQLRANMVAAGVLPAVRAALSSKKLSRSIQVVAAPNAISPGPAGLIAPISFIDMGGLIGLILGNLCGLHLLKRLFGFLRLLLFFLGGFLGLLP